jgi:hypothetical protein
MKPLTVCTLVLLVAAAGCERRSTDPVPAQAYVGGTLGCRQLIDFLGDINKHLLTDKQTSEKTKQIRVILDTAEPPLTEAATAMVRANNARDDDAFIDAFNALVDACVDAGYFGRR